MSLASHDARRKNAGLTTMTESTVRLRLNQQQLELIDNSIEAGESGSRDELICRALREFAATHLSAAANGKKS
jgi:Arc/MetJ-type ribon-helix-helix transcriptional regulator